MLSPPSPCIRKPLPRKNSIKPPPRALDRSMNVGSTGNSENCVKDREVISIKPMTKKRSDIVKPAKGPAIPKSNSDFTFGGGDFSGVIAPMQPICIDGSIVGRPTLNFFIQRKRKIRGISNGGFSAKTSTKKG